MNPRIAFAAVVVTALAAAPAADAREYRDACSKSATVVSGETVDVSRSTRDEEGIPTLDDTPIKHPLRDSQYVATKATVLTFGGARYRLAKDTFFALDCAGNAGQRDLEVHFLQVESGVGTLTARAGKQDGIGGREGGAYNHAGKAMTVTVRRVVKGNPSVQEMLDEGFNFGTTTFRQSGGGWAAITPHIGRSRRTNGLCHYAHGAVLRSTGASGGFLTGTVKWRELAPFSPR